MRAPGVITSGVYRPQILYAVLATAVAAPVAGAGVVLVVDLAIVPRPRLDPSYWGVVLGTHAGPPNRLPLDLIFLLGGRLGLTGALEVLLLGAVMFLAGYGMHALVGSVHGAARIYAGVLYAINPFVYDRVNSGQWFLLLGYALIPLALAAFLKLIQQGRCGPTFVMLSITVGIASVHMFVLLLFTCVVVTAWRRSVFRSETLSVVMAFGFIGAGSLYWLLPTPGVSNFLGSIHSSQLRIYQTSSDPSWGRVINVLALNGFWNTYDPTKAFNAGWPLFGAACVVTSIYGLWVGRRSFIAGALAVAGIGGLLLAVADTEPGFDSLFNFLFAHFAVVRAFREPEKGLALLALAYSYLGALAVDDLMRHRGTRWAGRGAGMLSVVLVALPLLFTYRMFGGLWGDVRPSEFPPSWAAANRVLEREAPGSRTLFLPWHGYMSLSFAHNRVVANPASAFFGVPILASRSVGEGASNEDNSDPVQSYVSELLARRQSNLAGCLRVLGVSHIILAREADFRNYGFVGRESGIVTERRWHDLVLYRLTDPGALLMKPTDFRTTAGCREIHARTLHSHAVSSTRYQLRRPAGRGTTLLALTYNPGWRLGTATSRPYAGLVNAFTGAADARVASFEAVETYRRNYTIGAVGLITAFLGSLSLRLRPRAIARHESPIRSSQSEGSPCNRR